MRFNEIRRALYDEEFNFFDSKGKKYTWRRGEIYHEVMRNGEPKLVRMAWNSAMYATNTRLMHELADTLDLHSQTAYYRKHGRLPGHFMDRFRGDGWVDLDGVYHRVTHLSRLKSYVSRILSLFQGFGRRLHLT
jgi:hypothetical protein